MSGATAIRIPSDNAKRTRSTEPAAFPSRSSYSAPLHRPEGSKPLPFHVLTHCAGALLLLAGSLDAQNIGHGEPSRHAANRVYFGQDIFIAPGQQIHNASCFFCSVQVEGDVSGNVFVLSGNLTVTGRVSGDAAVIGGNEVVDAQARVGGRTIVIGGNAVYESDESLSGNAYVLGGHISNFAGRNSPHRRVSLSPIFSVAIAILAVLLLGALLFPRPRRHPRS